MPILLLFANFFGISIFRLVAYAAIFVGIVTGTIAIRQHYINLGWSKHKAAIERQDNIAVDASKKVEERTQKCSDANGFWDVLSQACKLQGEETK